jgi:hypothetical protein
MIVRTTMVGTTRISERLGSTVRLGLGALLLGATGLLSVACGSDEDEMGPVEASCNAYYDALRATYDELGCEGEVAGADFCASNFGTAGECDEQNQALFECLAGATSAEACQTCDFDGEACGTVVCVDEASAVAECEGNTV